MKSRFMSLALVTGLILSSSQLARSQGTLYFDRNDFMNAALGIPGIHQSISFEGLPSDFVGPVLTIGNVTFTGRDLLRNSGSISAGAALYNFDSGFPMGIQFANGARAFGGDFSSFLSPYYTSFTARLALDNGQVLTFTAPTNPNSTFFGFTSPTPIRSFTYSDGGLYPNPNIGHQEMIANVYVVTVPEPQTLGLFALGALLLGWRLHKTRKP